MLDQTTVVRKAGIEGFHVEARDVWRIGTIVIVGEVAVERINGAFILNGDWKSGLERSYAGDVPAAEGLTQAQLSCQLLKIGSS